MLRIAPSKSQHNSDQLIFFRTYTSPINHSFPCLPCLCKLQAKALCQSSPKGLNQLQQLLLHHLCLTGPMVPLSMQNWVPYPYLGIFCRVVAVSTSRSVYLTMILVGAHLPTTPDAQPVENKHKCRINRNMNIFQVVAMAQCTHSLFTYTKIPRSALYVFSYFIATDFLCTSCSFCHFELRTISTRCFGNPLWRLFMILWLTWWMNK